MRRISTRSTIAWAYVLAATFAGDLIGLAATYKPAMEDLPAQDLVFAPLPLAFALIGMVAALVWVALTTGQLELGEGRLACRRVGRAPIVIAAEDVVRVARVRAPVVEGVRYPYTSYTVTARDGRSIEVTNSALLRAAKPLAAFHDAALEHAIAAALRELAAGNPLRRSSVSLYADRIEKPGKVIPLGDIDRIEVSKVPVMVTACDARGKPLIALPDDEMLILLLGKLGRRIVDV